MICLEVSVTQSGESVESVVKTKKATVSRICRKGPTILVTVETSTDEHSLRSLVGMGSESDCLFGQLDRILWRSDAGGVGKNRRLSTNNRLYLENGTR